MTQLENRTPLHQPVVALLKKRWRTMAALVAGLVIMTIMVGTGYFDHDSGAGIDWTHVAVYLCGVVVVAMQADRLFHR